MRALTPALGGPLALGQLWPQRCSLGPPSPPYFSNWTGLLMICRKIILTILSSLACPLFCSLNLFLHSKCLMLILTYSGSQASMAHVSLAPSTWGSGSQWPLPLACHGSEMLSLA